MNRYSPRRTYNPKDYKKQVRQFKTGAIRDLDDTKEDYIETISWRAFKRYAQKGQIWLR